VPNLAGIVLGSSERQFEPPHGPINLKGALLKYALLRFVSLTTANLEDADLSGADLAHARLDRVNLTAANLSTSCLDYADLGGANLTRLNLRGASLRFTRLSGAGLEAADLSGANLMHARLDQANLRAANLHRACLDYADFAGADLTHVNLCGSSLQNAKNLTSSQLQGSLGNEATILPPDLRGSVPWSPGAIAREVHGLRSRNQPPADGLVARLRSARRPGWIVLVLIGGILGGVGIWQETPRLPLSLWGKLDRFLSERRLDSTMVDGGAKPRTNLAVTDKAVATMPAAAFHAADLIEALAPASLRQQTAIALLRPSGPALLPMVLAKDAGTAIAELHPALDEVREIAARDANLTNGRPVLAVTSHASLAAPAFPSRATLAQDRSTPSPMYQVVLPDRLPAVKASIRTLALSALEPLPASLLKPPPRVPVLASLPPARRAVLSALPPGAEIALRPVRERARPYHAKPKDSSAPAQSEPPLLSVSLDNQTIDVYRGTMLLTSSKVSSGMPGHATKTGVFSILEKQTFHHSNIYSGAPMPWMQRLTRSGTALHGGVVPGYPASHGCIRLPFSFAPKLFQMTNVGETVVVAKDRLVPKLIEHPNLFQPPAAVASAAPAARIPQLRARDATGQASKDAALPPLLAEAEGATIHLLPVTELVAAAGPERSPDAGKGAASQDTGDAPLRILITRRTERDRMIGVQYLLAAMGYLKPQNFDGTFGKATLAAINAFQAANGLPGSGAFTDNFIKAVYQAAGKSEPPDGLLFVRQGFGRLFDVPIAIRQPDRPLGTEVYIALGAAPATDKTRWMALSLDGGTATSALDRIEIPMDVRRTIAERLTAGSTLIVADKSIDTAILPEGDDFQVWDEDPDNENGAAEDSPPPTPKQVNIKRAKPKQTAGPPPRRVRPTSEPDYGFPQRFGRPGWFSRW
jgi:lipoprotein-anchoring transpeptidase ErfK/SrfK/peptidoglycan hydrolase-like protein with peptidoglycan-binding domain